ncbi:hypothetical protein SAMN04488030_1651 [Aliiroseovarius halocynthiae]|uniref:Uncharacterized protein n=1 Tax=Aliiroseovarius halocynthiae TaxID=985055 RepID=A0A545SX22_9RHOB|nr:hypothetical protein [Aliiroseovarius halocynthiae]TQV69506.1 hypothetical protein FIL88_08160 [Aliiroseovarius halocynthiae]SMR72906.1 hypothetical protein SAMN04488030_1651 [Aliiroseovarius halocynthiae]
MKHFDKKAVKILLDAHWKSGWLDKTAVGASDDDILYAKSKGYWFDPIRTDHDDLVLKLARARREITPKEVGDAFLASLSSRRLELRSALGSFAFARQFPDHKMSPSEIRTVPSGAVQCQVCGHYGFNEPQAEDLNVLNFERHKWGGVRHDDVIYAWFDLSQFRREPQISPTKADVEIFQTILGIAANLPDDASPSVLARELREAVKSNLDERRVLIEILSMAGVLKPRNRPSYDREFVNPSQRQHTGQHNNDWGYPAIWWRGSDGVNASALAVFFPDIEFAEKQG